MNGIVWLRFEFIIHNKPHTLAFESQVVTISTPQYPSFHTKMEYVWTDSKVSQHLNPSNVSS
eukprot:scaffold84795_cov26-Cyclotella_meneghiniana.AAC.1